jgi:hypothetical protein
MFAVSVGRAQEREAFSNGDRTHCIPYTSRSASFGGVSATRLQNAGGRRSSRSYDRGGRRAQAPARDDDIEMDAEMRIVSNRYGTHFRYVFT